MARFLLKMNADAGNTLSAAAPMGAMQFTVRPLMPNSRPSVMGLGLASGEDWFLAETASEMDPASAWDECHGRVTSPFALGLAGASVSYAEPDILQPFTVESDGPAAAGQLSLSADDDPTIEHRWMNKPSIPHGARFDWHLGPDFSGLRTAQAAVLAGSAMPWEVRIGHLDTGYTDGHALLPEHLDRTRQRSFVSGESEFSAVDPFATGLLKNPGHGTGTIGLLAGGKLTGLAFDDENLSPAQYLGGAPYATVIPVRIAPSVVLLYTSAFARGLDYLLAPDGDGKPVDVVSMSMGGLASGAWTEAVNRAYDAGVVLCTAAGNNFCNLPTRNIVYPARYKRVIACCGVMEDRRPYADLPDGIMAGNYGPKSKMPTAMAAFSPNLPWAMYNNKKAFRWDGQGTSAATPQVAAAAALLIQKNMAGLKLLKPWQRVEAVRKALFEGARKSAGGGIDPKLGNGILDAVAALNRPLARAEELTMQPRDNASFSFLRVLTGLGIQADASATNAMLNVEILQLTQRSAELQGIIPDPEGDEPSEAQVRQFFSAITAMPGASKQLKATLSGFLAGNMGGGYTPPDESQPLTPEGVGTVEELSADRTSLTPPCRKLRGYVFDPSMSTKLQYIDQSETTYRIPWEHGLKRGPEGEYLKVVDWAHQPQVDLNSQFILAQDGLDPSEGNPQFRQQMVYTIGMRIISVFEGALGRLMNWAPDEHGNFQQHLTLYPYGLEAPNAFYSPQKKAIYFGYFKTPSKLGIGNAYPGGTVYTALSHDIVAHEMTHALLDGMHSAFREPSNPDVLAFHEAFADIVALLEQFSNADIVRSQCASVRGDLSMQSLLGNLAAQFGEATSGRAALRSAYLDFDKDGKAKPREPLAGSLETTLEPHTRGAVLLAAVYGAFLSIYHNRTVDLYRIASQGRSDVALHLLAPDLVNRLAGEASRSARHVLRMCIRALDYCPPVDITFGEFLRAIITADVDVVAEDNLHYRVAFIESFRRWGIYPEGLESLSIETLLWPPTSFTDSRALQPVFNFLRGFAGSHGIIKDRRSLFLQGEECMKELRTMLDGVLKERAAQEELTAAIGLKAWLEYEITRLRFSHKVSPTGSLKPQVLVSICQEEVLPDVVLPFRWGVTLVIDLANDTVSCCVRKENTDERRARQTAYLVKRGNTALSLTEPFMLLHQRTLTPDKPVP